MDVTIRKTQMGDAAAVATILKDLGWWDHINSEPLERTVQQIMDHIRSANADNSHSSYVAEVEGEVLGYVSAHWLPYLFLTGPEGYVSELFVHGKGRGKGIGTRLLDSVKKEAQERGCSRLALINGKKRESYKRKFYQHLGWREKKDMANFILPL